MKQEKYYKNIRLFKPCVGEEELENIKEVFERAWLGLGPMVNRFEEEWSKYIGIPCSVALNSCTAALHLALAVNQFPVGKKVLVPALTFVSTAHAVLYNRLEPVFIDVNDRSLTLDLEDLQRKVDKNCVAVIPVHIGGQPVPMEELNAIAHSNKLLVIEDCANCAGASYKGKKLGAWGDFGCFSFEEKKNMTSGDGGMICVEDHEKAEELRKWRWVGIDRDTWKRAQLGQENAAPDASHWYYEVSLPGYKYNMNDLAAAIGLAQLKKLDWMNSRRAELIKYYLIQLKSCERVRPAFPYELENSGYWLFAIRVPANKRDLLMIHLREQGIATGVHFMPITLHPLYRDYDKGISISKKVYKELVTLPLHPDLTEDDVDYVVDSILKFLKKQ